MGTLDPSLQALLKESRGLGALARSLVRDVERAEDAVQETLVRALERPGREPGALRAWLRTVLRNTLVQEQRGQARRRAREETAARSGSEPSALEVAERLEVHAVLLEAVRALEEPYRAVIVQRFFDGLPPREIARRLGVPVKTVHTRLDRGLERLRGQLDRRFHGDRRRWARMLLAVAPSKLLPELVLEGIIVGTKTKLAVAAGVLAGAAWLGRELVVSERPGRASGELAGLAAAPEGGAKEGSSLGELEHAAGPEEGARTAAPQRPAAAPASQAEPPAATGARLLVHVFKEGSGASVAAVVEVLAAEGGVAGGHNRLAGDSTDEDGRAQLDVVAGAALWVTADPKEADPSDPTRRATVALEPLAPGEERSVMVALPHGNDRTFYGRVVDAEDDRPLEGAWALLRGVEPIEDGVRAARTDRAGAFELLYASWAPGQIELRHAGYSPAELDLGRTDQAPDAPHVVRLWRAASIAAHVASDAEPGTLVLVARAEEHAPWTATLDESGEGRLDELPANVPLEVGLQAGGGLLWSAPEPWTLLPGECRELALDLAGSTLVYGVLSDQAAEPVAGQEVWALAAEAGAAPGAVVFHSASIGAASTLDATDEPLFRFLHEDERAQALVAVSDDAGRYELPSVPAGRWWIGPAPGHGNDALPARALLVELLPGESSRRLDLQGRRGLAIRGRVFGPDGGPLQAYVLAQHPPDTGEIAAWSEGDGSFELSPLAEGRYLLRALTDGAFGWGDGVWAEAGAEDVVLRIGLENSIGGHVVDAELRPVDAHVHLLQLNSSLGQSTSQGRQGAFLFTDLEPGEYSLQAEGADGRVAVRGGLVLEAGQALRDFVLELAEGARIRVVQNGARTVRCAILSEGVVAADSTLGGGGEIFEVVPAGPVRIELYTGGGEGREVLAARELEARAGRVETVEFDVP